jgi:Lon protease-like protein
VIWIERSKKNFKSEKELKEKILSTNNDSNKKVTSSLSNLLKVEKDLKKMNMELKKVVKKVRTLEKENSKLQKKLVKK